MKEEEPLLQPPNHPQNKIAGNPFQKPRLLLFLLPVTPKPQLKSNHNLALKILDDDTEASFILFIEHCLVIIGLETLPSSTERGEQIRSPLNRDGSLLSDGDCWSDSIKGSKFHESFVPRFHGINTRVFFRPNEDVGLRNDTQRQGLYKCSFKRVEAKINEAPPKVSGKVIGDISLVPTSDRCGHRHQDVHTSKNRTDPTPELHHAAGATAQVVYGADAAAPDLSSGEQWQIQRNRHVEASYWVPQQRNDER
ncbi:hypothetical protein SO802_033623 [Lithocarpus litseifolius]|uniref:Uncharacterized protein n=1 Tax=Lithocarpus litseifolius TaxID=425828 RepID=A0AAW2BEX2_9ROSI